LTSTTTPASSSPHPACSTRSHAGNAPGIAMITMIASSMTAVTSRSRRYPRDDPPAACAANISVSSELTRTIDARTHAASVARAASSRRTTSTPMASTDSAV
jgi:hypothetical protein